MYSILWLAFLCIISPALANTSCNGFDMFGMKCCIEKWTATPQDLQTNSNILYYVQSWTIYQKTTSGDVEMNSASQKFRYFQMLFERRSYKNLKYVEDLYIGDTKYTVALWQKCNHPEIRINGKEYRNDRGIFDVKSDNQYLRLYYYDFGMLNAIRCAPKAVTSTEYKVPSTEAPSTIIQNLGSTPATTAGTVIREPGQAIKVNPIILDNVKTYQQLNTSTLYDLVKEWGMDRKTDRKALAEQAGIDLETYKGTKAQNLLIRDYLMSKISVNIQATNTPDITLSTARFQKVQKIELRRIVGLRSYVWQEDRVNIAKEFGYEPQIYFWTRTQNLKIRSRLLNKVHKVQSP